jgi:hypothetical protein
MEPIGKYLPSHANDPSRQNREDRELSFEELVTLGTNGNIKFLK